MNKKRFIALWLILCLFTVMATACGSNGNTPDPEGEAAADELTDETGEEGTVSSEISVNDLIGSEYEDEDGTTMTLEEALPVLEVAGYVKTADGYKGTDDVDGVKSERLITAEGNHVTATLSYDYGSENKEMKKFYKKDENHAVSAMVASFLVVLAERANTTEGDMDYTIYVGGDKVVEGNMTLEEAENYMDEAPTD